MVFYPRFLSVDFVVNKIVIIRTGLKAPLISIVSLEHCPQVAVDQT